jgi:hypothetical protein
LTLNFLRGPGNLSLDLMRIGGASAFILYPLPYIYVAITKGVLPDPGSFGTGYGVMIGAVGAAICAKDIGVAKATGAANAS